MSSIPKRIFYVWGAGEKKKRDVNLCMLSWHKVMPDYEIIEINEDSVEYFNFKEELQNNQYFKMVYERKMYAFVADYIRIKVLYEHGGIYFDTDVCALNKLDKFLTEPAFVGIEGTVADIGVDWVEPAILGSQKGNKFLKRLVDFYDNEILKTPLYIMPDIFMTFLKSEYDIAPFVPKSHQEIIRLPDITLYPEKYFIPYKMNEEFSFDCIEPETCTMHMWNGSWNNKEIRYFQTHKHKMPLWLLDIVMKIRSFISFFGLIFNIRNEKINNKKVKFLVFLGKKYRIG